MKIDINRIPPQGLTLEEDIASSLLDLETDTVKFKGPIKIKAEVSKITNVVTVDLALTASMYMNCSRCFNEFESDFKKNLRINYPVNPAPHSELDDISMRSGVNKLEPIIDTSTSLECHGERSRTIDLDQDIREEIILDYPIKPLCRPDCKGLCPRCGKNLNEGGCSCGVT